MNERLRQHIDRHHRYIHTSLGGNEAISEGTPLLVPFMMT